MKGFVTIFFAILVFTLITPIFALAQLNIDIISALPSELGVEVIPDYPKPNSVVFVNLAMYTEDLDSAEIAWYLNGKVALQGKGAKQFSFRTGKVGVESKIEIRIKLKSGVTFSRNFSIIPASVDILWEADSYVPPFYQGKALHPKQGRLKLAAMPEFVKNGKRIPPSDLIYKWSNGLDVYESQSGYGKNVVIIDGALLGTTERISVLVTDPINNLVAQGFVDISTVNPEIVFYKRDPYYGFLFEQSLKNKVVLDQDEIEVVVSPYYITKEREGLLQYNWRLNGTNAPELSRSKNVVFRRPEEEGRSLITVEVENLARLLQITDSNLVVEFKDN